MAGLSLALLALAIGCYGVAGALLTWGSHGGMRLAIGNPLWLSGTALQGAAFLLLLVARAELPLVLAQTGIAASLAVTVVLLCARAGHPVGPVLLPVAGSVLGLVAVGIASAPGPAHEPAVWMTTVMVAGTVVVAVLATTAMPPLGRGVACGIGYSVGAVAARAVAPDLVQDPRAVLGSAHLLMLCTVAVGGIGAAQLHLTRGLATGRAWLTLATMYLVAVALPTLAGPALGDRVRSGGWGVAAAAGLCAAAASTVALARAERALVASTTARP